VAAASRRTSEVAGRIEALSQRLNEEAALVDRRVLAFVEGVRAA
jgi:hypothetical protein